MRVIDYILWRWDIDLARCIAVLLVYAGLREIYATFLFPVVYFIEGFQMFPMLMLGIWVFRIVVTIFLFWWAFALWGHRRTALMVTMWLVAVVAFASIVIAFAIPFIGEYSLNVAGIQATNPHPVVGITAVVLILPGLLLLLRGLSSAETRRRFAEAYQTGDGNEGHSRP